MAQNLNYQTLEKKLLGNSKSKPKEELKNYLMMAANGHFPLFFKEWIHEAANSSTEKNGNRSTAKKTIENTFLKLDRHHKIDRKQSALFQLDLKERNDFINAVLKIVEDSIVDQNKELH